MMLAYGAVAVLIIVVAGVVALLGIDSRRQSTSHWLDTVRQWQALIGSVLGFLTAASVLVLGQALQTHDAELKSESSAHAIGFGLALEAERISAGMEDGLVIPLSFSGTNLTVECQNFTTLLLTRDLPQETPVYKAVLSDLQQFGEPNLALFVRFFAFYADVRQELTLDHDDDCVSNAGDTMRHIDKQLSEGEEIYRLIGAEYGTIMPHQETPSASSNEPSFSASK